jgi:hypothetical protein
MPTSRSTPVRAVLATAAVVLVIFATSCSRNEAIGDEDAGSTTLGPTTSVAPGTSQPATDTTQNPGSSEPTPSSEPETDAFGHTPEEVAALNAAYAEAFRAECQRIWSSLGGGPLADPDFPEDQYSVDDCLFELDETWGELNDSVTEAATMGLDDAQIAASDLADPLCNLAATVCWSYGD